jgi:guanylate kinase
MTKIPRGHLYIVSAPSGAGKSSLVNALVERMPGVFVSISHTTRAQRPGEQDGQHYHFVDLNTFESLIESQAFLEHANVFGHYYGTSVQSVEAQLDAGHDVILEIDWQGAQQVRARLPGARSVFIAPPSIDALQERLVKRAQDSAEVIERRLSEARADMTHFDEYQYVIVNENFNDAVDQLCAIVVAGRLEVGRQQPVVAQIR